MVEQLIEIKQIEAPESDMNYQFAGFVEDGMFVAPDALVCITGGLYQPKSGGGSIKKGPASFQKGANPYDPEAMGAGGKARAIAVARLARQFPKARVVTGASFATEKEQNSGMPTYARQYSDFLVQIGVKSKRILAPEDSFAINTFTELISEFIALAKETDAKLITVCTNAYHVARVEQMLRIILDENKPNGDQIFRNYQEKFGIDLNNDTLAEARQIFKNRKTKINIIAAEEVLKLIDQERDKRSFTDIIEAVYQQELSPDQLTQMPHGEVAAYEERRQNYLKLIENETTGVRQLQEGTYLPRN